MRDSIWYRAQRSSASSSVASCARVPTSSRANGWVLSSLLQKDASQVVSPYVGRTHPRSRHRRQPARNSPAPARNNMPALAGGWERGVEERSDEAPCVARVGRTYLIRMPEMARAITRRWISEVPSKMV
jgi:hypothetical protein